jgi:hypothetical protein
MHLPAFRCLVLAAGCLLPAAGYGQAPRLASADLDEKLLREQQLPTQGPALLDFFRRRTPSPDVIRHFDELLARCGSDDYDERADATAVLMEMGEVIRPLLLRAVAQPPTDREVLHRAAACLAALPEYRDGAPAMATARLLAVHKPPGALAVLLDYVPFAPTEPVRQEVQLTLNALAAGDKPEPVLLEALKDPDPARRAAAGEALARSGPAGKALAVALLRDLSPRVRLRLGVALAEAGERQAVPVLIALLAELPTDLGWAALDPLLRLADDEPPLPVLGGTQAPAQVAKAWRAWWEKAGGAVDLATLSARPPVLGQTLLTYAGTGLNGKGKVAALGPDKEILWQFEGLRHPVDVQTLGKGRVLVAEYLGRRVTERDTAGNILWEKAVALPVACQRLPGGLTFIGCRQQLIVVDRQGVEVFAFHYKGPSILAAQRLRDGQTVFVDAGGQCHLLDPQGNELKCFRVGQLYTMGGNVEVLPAGRVLVPLYYDNLVAEYDFDGNVLWKASVQRPTSAVRLPGGNTLVVCQPPSRVVEINADGEEVWAYTPDGRPCRARRR